MSAIELRTGAPLLAIGGFSGRDESPTLERFQTYVAVHQVGHDLVRQRRNRNGRDGPVQNDPAQNDGNGKGANNQNGPGQGGRDDSAQSTSAQITAWVRVNYPMTLLGNMEIYHLDG
ncbi:hypothetical protein OHB26_16615 [Nocardia sp. NBC_01503]|uniref:hypothetical protein n=1 Tax=Nocardia sp. NBC_01503 TaxID=2975997 RepID=UPI002E7BD04F|nr:hypothetical protein [Nocardia sp. NBC_01503]WTL35673.1 hypothetical protein OHB26_16615 [Nocardia sp. NBC_01503]